MQQLDWNATIDSIREAVPQTQFQTWLKPVQLIRCDERTVVLGVESRFHEEWLRSHYTRHLTQAIRKQCGSELQLEFEILVQNENQEAARTPVERVTTPLTPSPPSRPALRIVGPAEEAKPAEGPNLPIFNQAFVELDFNRVASGCARLLVAGVDPSLNPLIIEGGVGMGKTHLLAEIGNSLHRANPKLRIRYTNFETFTAEMVTALKSGDMLPFKRKYRDETDCLLFDDLHGLTKRLKTQEELLYIFNEITSRGGRVVFTTTVNPRRLQDFIEPLKSRLLSLMLAEIRYPSFEDRVTMLNKVCEQNSIKIEGPVLRSLADKGQKDIRELIGTLLRVHLQAKLENKSVDNEFLNQEGWSRDGQKQAVTMDEIVSLVEHNFGIGRVELASKSRKSHTAWARQVAMYLARHYTLLPLEEIGKTFGRDHATVIHAFQKVTETMEGFPQRRYEVEFLKQKLQSRSPQSSNL